MLFSSSLSLSIFITFYHFSLTFASFLHEKGWHIPQNNVLLQQQWDFPDTLMTKKLI